MGPIIAFPFLIRELFIDSLHPPSLLTRYGHRGVWYFLCTKSIKWNNFRIQTVNKGGDQSPLAGGGLGRGVPKQLILDEFRKLSPSATQKFPLAPKNTHCPLGPLHP